MTDQTTTPATGVTLSAEHFAYLMNFARVGADSLTLTARHIRNRHLDNIEEEARTETTPELASAVEEPGSVLGGALKHIDFLRAQNADLRRRVTRAEQGRVDERDRRLRGEHRIAELEADVRALGGDPDRMGDPARRGECDHCAGDHFTRDHTLAGACPCVPAPEVREVPAGEAREGDTVARQGKVGHVYPGGFTVDWGPGVWENLAVGDPGLTVSRPVSPLPDQPGAVAPLDVIPMEEIGALRTRATALAAEMDVRHAATTRLYEELERLGRVCDWQRAEIRDLRMAMPAGAGVDEGGKR